MERYVEGILNGVEDILVKHWRSKPNDLVRLSFSIYGKVEASCFLRLAKLDPGPKENSVL